MRIQYNQKLGARCDMQWGPSIQLIILCHGQVVHIWLNNRLWVHCWWATNGATVWLLGIIAFATFRRHCNSSINFCKCKYVHVCVCMCASGEYNLKCQYKIYRCTSLRKRMNHRKTGLILLGSSVVRVSDYNSIQKGSSWNPCRFFLWIHSLSQKLHPKLTPLFPPIIELLKIYVHVLSTLRTNSIKHESHSNCCWANVDRGMPS